MADRVLAAKTAIPPSPRLREAAPSLGIDERLLWSRTVAGEIPREQGHGP